MELEKFDRLYNHLFKIVKSIQCHNKNLYCVWKLCNSKLVDAICCKEIDTYSLLIPFPKEVIFVVKGVCVYIVYFLIFMWFVLYKICWWCDLITLNHHGHKQVFPSPCIYKIVRFRACPAAAALYQYLAHIQCALFSFSPSPIPNLQRWTVQGERQLSSPGPIIVVGQGETDSYCCESMYKLCTKLVRWMPNLPSFCMHPMYSFLSKVLQNNDPFQVFIHE
jgi:hypothetical protein